MSKLKLHNATILASDITPLLDKIGIGTFLSPAKLTKSDTYHLIKTPRETSDTPQKRRPCGRREESVNRCPLSVSLCGHGLVLVDGGVALLLVLAVVRLRQRQAADASRRRHAAGARRRVGGERQAHRSPGAIGSGDRRVAAACVRVLELAELALGVAKVARAGVRRREELGFRAQVLCAARRGHRAA